MMVALARWAVEAILESWYEEGPAVRQIGRDGLDDDRMWALTISVKVARTPKVGGRPIIELVGAEKRRLWGLRSASRLLSRRLSECKSGPARDALAPLASEIAVARRAVSARLASLLRSSEYQQAINMLAESLAACMIEDPVFAAMCKRAMWDERPCMCVAAAARALGVGPGELAAAIGVSASDVEKWVARPGGRFKPPGHARTAIQAMLTRAGLL